MKLSTELHDFVGFLVLVVQPSASTRCLLKIPGSLECTPAYFTRTHLFPCKAD